MRKTRYTLFIAKSPNSVLTASDVEYDIGKPILSIQMYI